MYNKEGKFKNGDFVKVLHRRLMSNGEVVDWWRPALWIGWDNFHNVVYVDGTKEQLRTDNKINWVCR